MNSYRIKMLKYGIVLSLTIAACTRADSVRPVETKPEPKVYQSVEHDFDAIKKAGTIKLLTRYTSNSYFLKQGVARGFEYELVEDFAQKHNLSVEVVILGANDDPYELLNNGTGDIIAANLSVNPERRQWAAFTRPYNLVNQVLAIHKDYAVGDHLNELGPITVSIKKSTSYYKSLNRLKEQGAPLNIETVSNDWDTEGLLQAVSRGELMATVADHNILRAAMTYLDNLVEGPVIARNDTIALAVRRNAPLLKNELDDYLTSHFRFSQVTGRPLRSEFLNVLSKKYYTDRNEVAKNIRPVRRALQMGMLSNYDDIIRQVADTMGVDWKMVASVIAQESKFDPYAESWMGAKGLMQIMPQNIVDQDSLNLFDPNENVRVGIRILSEHLDHYAYMDSTNQWALALATYNAGVGHIADARRIVIDMNKDPNKWENVADALIKLMRRQYYQHARYGFCRGIETVKYVNEILNRYATYSAILAMSSPVQTDQVEAKTIKVNDGGS